MKVALVSTEALKTPPARYGGVESMVYDLCMGLTEKGVDVTLFGCNGSSSPSGKLIEIIEEGWGRTGQCEEFERRIVDMKHTLKKFDVVHDNSHVKPCWKIHKRVLNTLHWKQNPSQCHRNNVVAISEGLANWARPLNKGRDIKVVHHGCDLSKYAFKKDKSERFLFLSAMTPAKGADVALSVAKDINLKIDFAGLGGSTSAAVEQESKTNPNIRYFGEVTEEQKVSLYQNAKALIFPTGVHGNWEEPFGLCLVPDSPILTLDKGVQKIKDIKVGDKVLTHKGRFMRVSNVIKKEYNGDMIKITPHKLRISIVLTPEHRVLGIKTVLCLSNNKSFTSNGKRICNPGACYYIGSEGRKYKWCKYVKGEEPFTRYKTEWIMAKDLKVGDFVAYPKVKEEVDIKKVRLLEYIDDILMITGDSYEDETKQIDLFEGFVDTKIKLTGYQVQKTTEIPAEIELTEDLMRLFGYYIAEGNISGDHQVQFSFNINEDKYVDDVEKLMKNIFGLDASHAIERQGIQTHNLIYSSKLLRNIFQNMFSPKEYITKKGKGSKANIVRIPSKFLNLPLKKLAQLLKGEWRGDGTYLLDNKKNKTGYQMKTTSETLAYQLQYILARFGILASMRIDNSRARHNEKWSQQYLLEIFGKDAQIFNRIIEDNDVNLENIKVDSKYIKGENLYYTPIRNIEILKYNGDIFNLEVEEDNSYISSIIVHNCAIEAMSTGTPIITWNNGAMPEIVVHNQTGYICNSIDDIKNAIRTIDNIKPENCRKRVEENFTYQVMAKKYIKLYKKLIDGKHW